MALWDCVRSQCFLAVCSTQKRTKDMVKSLNWETGLGFFESPYTRLGHHPYLTKCLTKWCKRQSALNLHLVWPVGGGFTCTDSYFLQKETNNMMLRRPRCLYFTTNVFQIAYFCPKRCPGHSEKYAKIRCTVHALRTVQKNDGHFTADLVETTSQTSELVIWQQGIRMTWRLWMSLHCSDVSSICFCTLFVTVFRCCCNELVMSSC